MDAITLLTADHNRVRGLFARFKAAHEADAVEEMSEIAATCFAELEVHTGIEEDVFYPRVKETNEDVSELVDEGLQEHHVVDVLMEEMKAMEPGTDDWVAKFTVLMENVEHHAEEEESEMFPQLRSKLGADVLEPLAEELEAAKKQRGAPVLADKIDLTKEQLLELAREQEIPGRSSMDHEELAATVAPQS
jgi:hemerythrin superfamily protein